MAPRDFKIRCENISLELRRELGLANYSPLSSERLASHIDAKLITPAQIPGLSSTTLNILLENENAFWSAITISCSGIDLVIYNPTRNKTQQYSDIMRELSHIIIGHKPGRLFFLMNHIVLRVYDNKQEEEAAYLASCLLLPREALLFIEQTMSQEEACRVYHVSENLLQSRLNEIPA